MGVVPDEEREVGYFTFRPQPDGTMAEDRPVRDVHPASGSPDDTPSMDSFLDEIADHDTVVLGRPEDLDSDDPRARIPAWEDIVFGVRRNR